MCKQRFESVAVVRNYEKEPMRNLETISQSFLTVLNFYQKKKKTFIQRRHRTDFEAGVPLKCSLADCCIPASLSAQQRSADDIKPRTSLPRQGSRKVVSGISVAYIAGFT